MPPAQPLSPPRHGFTLVELLVGSALLCLLSLLVAGSLSSGLGAWQRSQVRSEVQQNVLLALTRLQREMGVAPASSIVVYPHTWNQGGEALAADSVAMLSSRDEQGTMALSPEGDPRYSRIVIYWIRRDTAEMWETVLPLSPPAAAAPHPLLPPAVATALATGNGHPPPSCGNTRRVARYMRRFSCREEGKTFHLVLETEIPPFRSMLQSSILPLGRALGGVDD